MKPKPLPYDKIRNYFNPKRFHFKSTKDVKPLEDVIGQKRAVKAIEFGLGMKGHGYNIFVTGLSGTGKATIVQRLLEKIASNGKQPDDWVFAHNFSEPDHPKAFSLPAGLGCQLERDMKSFVAALRKDIPKAFDDKDYEKKKAELVEEFTERKRKILNRLETYAKRRQVVIHSSSMGYQTVPLVKGKGEMTPEEYNALEPDERKKIDEKLSQVQSKIAATIKEVAHIDAKAEESLEKLNKSVAEYTVQTKLTPLLDKYGDSPEVEKHLKAVRNNVVENISDFLGSGEEKGSILGLQIPQSKPSFSRYGINVAVDNCSVEGSPVVVETNPTYNNLFGRIEKRAQFGTLVTDFTLIKAGSMLRANGGYLIVDIEGVLSHPFAWDALKRTLRNKELRIEDVGEEYGFMTTVGLKPEPIPLDIKVIMLGRADLFHLLEYYDESFRKTFKIRADFDSSVKLSPKVSSQYAAFIAKVCNEDNLRHFDPTGVAAVIEYAQKQVSDQKKASIQFGRLVSLLREASYWAEQNKSRFVTEQEVEAAVGEQRFRANLVEEKIRESIMRDIITLDLTGSIVGQVNGLAVYQTGEYSFGIPSRITASTFAGKGNVVQIDREVKMSGSTHDKGVLILSAYLNSIFAKTGPLSLSASVTFEQSYSHIDGDSASSTELYALLSSLSGYPIKQSIAVTGSVDQRGRVQAIGGANQKIEGYFDVCLQRGLTGNQGVMIPASNVQHLMLRKDLTEVVKAGLFNIYPVKTIEEGIELLTGIPAGKRRKSGKFPKGTVYAAVEEKLRNYHLESLKYRHSLKKELGIDSKNDKEEI